MIRRKLEHPLDVAERARDILQRRQAQVDQLLAQQQRFLRRRRRFTLQGLLEDVGDLFVTPLGEQASHHALARGLVAGGQLQDALAYRYRQILALCEIPQQLRRAP
jgi:hypothetical protein